jgi:hypothetical protein
MSPDPLTGTLHVYVAFDWGEEIDLERTRALVPAEVRDLPRRRRMRVPPADGVGRCAASGRPGAGWGQRFCGPRQVALVGC